MLLYKRDNCRKNIFESGKFESIELRTKYKMYEFCAKCGDPFKQILKRFHPTEK